MINYLKTNYQHRTLTLDTGRTTGKYRIDTGDGALTVHLHKQLVQGVLLLALASKVPAATLLANCINLVHKQDTGSVFPGQCKHVTNLKQGSTHSFALSLAPGQD